MTTNLQTSAQPGDRRATASAAPTASVGLGGINRRADVIVVQELLTRADMSPGPVDGRCGRLTIAAIERFQRDVIKRPDGRVDVDGPTIRRLRSPNSPTGAHANPVRADALPIRASSADRTSGSNGRTNAVPTRPIRNTRTERPADRQPNSFWRGRTLLPNPEINRGLASPTSSQLTVLLGDPAGADFTANVATESVGPFRATGFKPALASLRSILARVHHDLPDLYGLLGNNGMRVVRKARGRSTYSLHSWGIAIDFIIAGDAPPLGTSYSYRGLDALAPFFHAAGWYWGGGYRNVARKDPMHFECGLALVRSFAG